MWLAGGSEINRFCAERTLSLKKCAHGSLYVKVFQAMAEEGTARATLSALFFLHFHYATDHTVKKVVQYVRPQYFFLYFSYISGNMPGIYSIVYPTLPLFFFTRIALPIHTKVKCPSVVFTGRYNELKNAKSIYSIHTLPPLNILILERKRKKKKRERCCSFEQIYRTMGLISADRSNKATLLLTIPRSIKVVCNGFISSNI